MTDNQELIDNLIKVTRARHDFETTPKHYMGHRWSNIPSDRAAHERAVLDALDSYDAARSTLPQVAGGDDALKSVNEFCDPPTQDDLENLWRVVVTQDTGELKATFLLNWLRGTIKIPDEVRTRIRTSDTIPQPEAANVALDALSWIISHSKSDFPDEVSWRVLMIERALQTPASDGGKSETPTQDALRELSVSIQNYFEEYKNVPKRPKWCERVEKARERINAALVKSGELLL